MQESQLSTNAGLLVEGPLVAHRIVRLVIMRGQDITGTDLGLLSATRHYSLGSSISQRYSRSITYVTQRQGKL
jgi:hypothetical protein